MILSKFNFYQSKDDYWIIYNTASSNCIVLKKDDYYKFYQFLCSEEENEEYIRLGFYSYEENEFEKIVKASENILSNFTKKKFRVLTTTACNAKCPYCYEAGVKTVWMNEQTANAVANFILEQSENVNTIEIEWFGGEPLLNTKAIDLISNLIKAKKKPGVNFLSTIVSNGSLIDEDIIKKMCDDWNLYQIQITLDGMEEKYEKVKALGKGSFKKIIKVIEKLVLSKIKVVIRLNFDNENVEELSKLITYLSSLWFSKNIEVYPAKINDGLPRKEFIYEKETIKMYQLLHDAGFMKNIKLLPKTLKTPCAASHKGYYTINADGNLFKCDRKLLLGNSVGNVFNPLNVNKNIEYEWESLKLPKKCHDCKLFPLCWGGCIYERRLGLDYCYLTNDIIHNNLKMILDDYLKCISQGDKNE